LAERDLDRAPLAEIIQPFEILGLHFKIVSVSLPQVTVEIGESYGTIGSGGTFLLQRLAGDSFRVTDTLAGWIA